MQGFSGDFVDDPWFRDSPFQKKAHGFPCDPKGPEKSISILTQIFLCEIFGGDQKQIRSNCEGWDVFQRLQLLSLRIIFWCQEDSWAYSTSTKTCSNPPPKQKNAERIFTSKNLLESAVFFSTNIFQVVSRWRSPRGLLVRAPFHQTFQVPKIGGILTYKSWADVRKNLHLL